VIDGSSATGNVPSDEKGSPLGRLETLVQSALANQPGWADGTGVTLTDLSDLIDEWEDDDDALDDQFYDAIDNLEAAGFLRVENGEEDDVIYPAAAAESSGGAPVVEAVPAATETASSTQEASAAAASYDLEAEAAAAAAVLRAVQPLKRFGLDADDTQYVPALRDACSELTILLDGAPNPVLRDDPRLVGDWQLIGTTSKDVAERKALTGLGAAPFTAPVALFYTLGEDGSITAKEVLEFFGNPCVVNELRGKFGFDGGGTWIQEKYDSADLSGVANSPQFSEATATTKGVGITSDGSLRLGFVNGDFFAFKKLGEGELGGWLQEKRLPWVGGTVATLDPEAMAKAYPYLAQGDAPGGGGGGGDAKGGGGGNPFGFKMPWD
jgi:hypothetical protein